MGNDDQHMMNIRVPKAFIAKMDEHIEHINKNDEFGRKLTRSSFMRACVEKALEVKSNG